MEQKFIYNAFEGKLVGSFAMKQYVCFVLSLMDKNIISYVTSTCWFISSFDDAWAFTFGGNDLKNQHLIFLSDALLFQSTTTQIYRTIAHEIGHVILKHRNSIIERQSKNEIRKQEKEADDFAKKYITRL